MGVEVDTKNKSFTPEKVGIKKMHFVDNIAYTRYMEMQWDKTLKGVQIYFWIFEVKDYDDDEKYGRWTFPSAQVWDSFFYSSMHVPVCRTEDFKLGNDSVMGRDLKVTPNEIIKKLYEVNRTALGIPIEYRDK